MQRDIYPTTTRTRVTLREPSDKTLAMIIVTTMQTADNFTDGEGLDTNVTLGFALIVEICWRNGALGKGLELGFAESRS